MVLTRAIADKFLKQAVIIVLLSAPIFCAAQKIKLSDYNKQTGKWRIETFAFSLKAASHTKMDVVLKGTDTSFVLQLSGSGIGTNTLDAGSELLLFLDNDSAITLRSPGVQSIDYSVIPPSYNHSYPLSAEQLEALRRYNLMSVKKFSAGGSDDILIEKKNASRLKDASNLIYAELKKTGILASVAAMVQPAFPGGSEAFSKFVNRNFQSSIELKADEKKKVVVEFLVQADGGITNLTLVQPVTDAMNTEVVRILKRMPKWKPASQNGKYIDAVVKKELVFHRSGDLVKIDL